MTRAGRAIALLCCTAAGAGVVDAARAQIDPAAPPTLAAVLAGLAERTQGYYDRISTIICEETVTQQELKFNLAPTGKPRVTVYELSVAREPRKKGDGDGEFRVERTLQYVNGRPARKHEEPGCTDPKTGTPEPLGFLLPKNQRGFKFALAVAGREGPESSLALDFAQTAPERVNITWHGNCFNADGGGIEGRLWFDPRTYDVLQVRARLPRPFFVPIPSLGIPTPAVRVERSEMIMRFTRVKFERPDEVVLLPESTESLTVFRGVPSMRTTQTLSNFRRFLSESVVRPAE